jgi:polyisoprenoid-binding protein YceI
MPSYTIDSKASKLAVTARSSVHNTNIEWSGFSGTIDAELEALEDIAADLSVDMTTADAGDWLKNRKLRKEMDFDKHPSATLKIEKLEKVQREGAKISATLHGALDWRGKQITVVVTGSGTLNDKELRAQGTFDINMTELGITPPKVLMIKVEDVVSCKVDIVARVA